VILQRVANVRVMFSVCLGSALGHAAMSAQTVASYRAQAETLCVELRNPYRMYWVRGRDTVGEDHMDLTIERQVWRADSLNLVADIIQSTLTVARRSHTDTFTVSPLGRVIRIDGRAPGLNDRVDLLLGLPATPLTVGSTWGDTIDSRAVGPAGQHLYVVQRQYRVTRQVDTLGSVATEVQAKGTVHYRDAWWVDSTAGSYAWVDVAGPVTESYWFDSSRGRLLARYWSMDLRGQGGAPDTMHVTDTVPAGLRSQEVQSPVTSQRAAILTRSLPGGDSSMSLNQGAILLHTVEREPSAVESGMARNDGLVGTARSTFMQGIPQTYEALWTDSSAAPTRQRIVRRDAVLEVSRTGAHDTTIAVPTGVWGIADYAMQEHLVPILLQLPRDGASRPLAIYRPYAGHWDRAAAGVRVVAGVYLVTIVPGDSGKAAYFLITPDGDLLYGENSDPTGAWRAPLAGSARAKRLKRFSPN
jgi:hypothetical protein